MQVEALDHLVLNVRDVDVTLAWYERVLGMIRRETHIEGQPSRMSLHFGDQKINVRPLSADKHDWFTAENAVTGSADLCFLTETGPERVVEHLHLCKVPIEIGPIDRQGARGRLRSVYCRDPDGSLIEISSYR
jgi:catechol 2,3-dioxygenase-like lactoylglutathione lyase family enzyme